MNRTAIVMFTAAFAAMMSNPASAAPTGAHWEAICNRYNPVTGEETGLHLEWNTFDLFVTLEPGDTIGAIDFGIAGPNYGLSTDGTFYQTPAPFGSDSVKRNLSFAEFSLTAPFDTAVAMNNEDLSFGAAMTWDENGVTGAWFSTNHNAVEGPVWVARVTISSDALFLGGQIFVSGDGPNGEFGMNIPQTGVVNIPQGAFQSPGDCTVPTSGAIAILALPAISFRRRRR